MEDQHDRGRRDGGFSLATVTEIERELPFHLVGAGCDFYQYPVDRPFGYPAFQWIQTIRGSGELIIDRANFVVPESHGMLLYPDETHRYHALEAPWYVNWITFSGHDVEGVLHHLGILQTEVLSVSAPEIIAETIHAALRTLKSRNPLHGIDASVFAYQFLMDLLKYVQPGGQDSHGTNTSRLADAFQLIENEIHRQIAIEELAATVGVTEQYFCQIFKNVTGKRPVEYINQRRVERAKEILLREPDTCVRDVGARVGLESSSYFATVFRKCANMSPRQFRETNA
ncbi:MAG: AraC family transcriptional regulator [Spirochaetales bacterium]|nr:AraC family transcriptional regulator [Spirochaetales bacterium]